MVENEFNKSSETKPEICELQNQNEEAQNLNEQYCGVVITLCRFGTVRDGNYCDLIDC